MKIYHPLLTLAFLCLFLPNGNSQIQVKFIDINPDTSSLDPRDPVGASGGRVNGLGYASDGSTYYAASEWGGIYKSTDTGRKWKRLDKHLPMATWDIEVDPSNSNKVYATSFFDGRTTTKAGINVSSDAGETWVHPSTATPPAPPYTTAARRAEPSAFGISIDPDNNNNVYIGTNAGLAISNNAGATWRYVDPTPADGADNIWDVVVHNSGIIDLVGDDGHRRSTDGGVTWTTAVTGPPLPPGRGSIAVSPDEHYVLFAIVGTTMYESTNAGDSWTPFTYPRRQGRIPFVATNQRSGSTYDLWFGDVNLYADTMTTPATPAQGGPSRGLDGTWRGPYTRSAGGHTDCADIVFNPTVSQDACPVLFASDGGVYYNTRTGANCHTPLWSQPDSTPHALWLFGMDGAPQAGAINEDLYFGNQDNGTFGSTNAGASKPSWNNRDCCDGFSLTANTNQVLYSMCCWGGRANRLFLRNQGMTGGSEINTYPPGNIRGFSPTADLTQFGPSNIALITTSGFFITNNINANPIVWTQLGAATSPPTMRGVQVSRDASNNPVFFIQQTAGNLRTADQIWRFNGTAAAGTWQQISSPTPGGGFTVFDVDPNDANHIIACHIDASNNPSIRMTTDGGTTWTSLPQLDNLMTGNGAFLYRTQRGPTNFTSFGGYPQPSLLAFYPQDPNIIVAGGVDSGIFVSKNGGDCWKRITDPLDSGNSGIPHIPRPQFAYFSQQPDLNGSKVIHAYIGTQGKGVWRFEMTIGSFQNSVVTRPQCAGGCDGSIDLVYPGEPAGTTYSWSNGATTQDINGLCAGDYTVTVTDANGCEEASFTVPAGADVIPPTITCPGNITRSNDAGTCEAMITYSVSSSDNCAGETLTQTAGLASGTSFPVGVTTNTFRVTDSGNNTANCSFTVTINDTEKPTITCPGDITVACDTSVTATGSPVILDNCDPNPALRHSTRVTSSDCDWFCELERTFVTTDGSNNVNQCVQEIEKDVSPLIQRALAAVVDADGDGTPDPFVMGFTSTSLTIDPASAACITGWMPYVGTTPTGLVRNRGSVGADCKPGLNPIDGNGKITNPLFGEGLKLALILRLDPNFGTTKLSSLACTIPPIVDQNLSNNADISELMDLTNKALGNLVLVGFLDELLSVLTCVNDPVDLCDFE